MINIHIDGNTAIIFEINCETDFVANSIKFKELIKKTTEKLFSEKPSSLDEARDKIASLLADAVIAVGEKVVLRHFELIIKSNNENFDNYIHMKGKSAAIVVINNNDQKFLII